MSSALGRMLQGSSRRVPSCAFPLRRRSATSPADSSPDSAPRLDTDEIDANVREPVPPLRPNPCAGDHGGGGQLVAAGGLVGPEAVQRVELLRLRFEENLPIRTIAAPGVDSPPRCTRRPGPETAGRLEVVAFHHPGGPETLTGRGRAESPRNSENGDWLRVVEVPVPSFFFHFLRAKQHSA